MRPPPDPLRALLFDRTRLPQSCVAGDAQVVGAVETWSGAIPTELPYPPTDQELLHATQRRRPWMLLWKALFGLLLLWATSWLICTKALRPTHSELKAAGVATSTTTP